METKNVVMFTTADGHMRYWHATSGKFLGTPVVEDGNQIFAMDVNVDGTRVATAGMDCKVRVYDTASRRIISTLSSGTLPSGEASGVGGHSNRVFALKYSAPLEPYILLSGGWDNTVQIWDSRVGTSVRSVFGPNLVGDSLDMDDGVITTGSHRRFRAVQTWDMGTGKLIDDVPWIPAEDGEACMIMSSQVGHVKKGLLAAGGCGSREVRLVKSGPSGAVLGRLANLTSPVHSLSFSPLEDQLAVICAHQILIADLKFLPPKLV
jgi:WD40 repeat protein